MSGMMAITGPPDGPPCTVGVAVTDVLTALYNRTMWRLDADHKTMTSQEHLGQWRGAVRSALEAVPDVARLDGAWFDEQIEAQEGVDFFIGETFFHCGEALLCPLICAAFPAAACGLGMTLTGVMMRGKSTSVLTTENPSNFV